ncbi:MAG: Jag protein [Fusobacteriales bacterium]|nr:MAG: Jag protein [Fusobacteriales bacterium]
MEKTIEVKAIDREKAIERALKILDINFDSNIYEIETKEKIKPKKKFFGLLGIENGLYQVSIFDKKKISKKVETNTEKKENKSKDKKVEKKEVKKVNKEKEIEKTIKKESKVDNSLEEIKEISNVVKDLLTKMRLELEVEVKRVKEKSYLVSLLGKDNAIIIGQKGKTLNNFEYILNSLLKNYRIEVDVENFKEKRKETLKNLAKKMAEKVIKTSKTVRLNAMPARERKIIHEIVGKYQGLDTFSEGREPKRYIVIKKKK